jgi:hypothetical protein
MAAMFQKKCICPKGRYLSYPLNDKPEKLARNLKRLRGQIAYVTGPFRVHECGRDVQ